MDDKSLLAILNSNPEMRKRVEGIANIVQATDGGIQKADDAEFRIRDELRELGRETLQAWADQQNQTREAEIANLAGDKKKRQENYFMA